MASRPSFDLKLIAQYKEDSQLEVKSAKGGIPKSLWETYSAFANSDGGIIILGVSEKRQGKLVVEGIDDSHKLLKDFWNIVNNRQKISCNILTDSMAYVDTVEGKDVIVIQVPRAERTSRPVYVGADPRSGTYRRNFEGDYHCSLEEVSLMIRDSALVTDDNKLLTEFDANIFCKETVSAYRNIFRLVRQNHLWNNEDDTLFMRRIGAVREDKSTGKFHPTVAGLLMFGYESDITTVFPNYFLDYQENRTNGISARWTDRIMSQSGDWSGNVFDFLLKIIPKLQSDLKVPFMLNGNERYEDTPLHKAVREATVNMVANADFYGRRGVVAQKNAEGFKFANPGGMRVSLKEAIQDNASDPRNGVMMKMLALVGYGERAGSGLQGIFKVWQSVYGSLPKLKVTTSGGNDRTTLSLNFEGHQPDVESLNRLYVPQNVAQKDENVAQNVADVAQNVADVAQKGENVAQNVADVAQNVADVAQKGENVAQNVADVAQNVADVPQNVADVAQNVPQSVGEKIIQIIKNEPQISRGELAERLSVAKKTIERYLKILGFKWEGRRKTGYWILKNNEQI